MNREGWLTAVSEVVPADAIPDRPDIGERYPWRAVTIHAAGRELAGRVRRAVEVVREAAALGVPWRIALSGKDSRAVALVVREAGLDVRAITVADDAAMPGEEEHLGAFARAHGLALDWIRPGFSVMGLLRAGGVSLVGDLHSRRSDLAGPAFYEPLRLHREAEGYEGIMWGIRASESRGRRLRRKASGLLYRCSEGWRCQPIADWTDMDVHAWLALNGHALHPVYHCIDPGMAPLSIRTDWWFAGGWTAQLGHYAWLRRWWPALWDQAVSIDPAVGVLS